MSAEPGGYSQPVPVFALLLQALAFLSLQILELLLRRWLVLLKQVREVERHPVTLKTAQTASTERAFPHRPEASSRALRQCSYTFHTLPSPQLGWSHPEH